MDSQYRLERILAEYREQLREVLGDDLDSVVLFGSQARGDAADDSDIDVLCIMKDPFDYGELILKTSQITGDTSLKHDVVLSRAFTTVEDYEARQTPFLMNVRREGVPV